MSEWREVSPQEAGVEFGVPGDPEKAIALLLSEPSSRDFLRVEPVEPSESEASFDFLISGTRIFIKKEELKDLRGDVMAALAAWVLSQSLTWSAATALFRKGSKSIRKLTPEEAKLLRTILRMSHRDEVVQTDALLGRFKGTQAELDHLLAELARRGVIRAEGTGWRVAP